MAKYIFYLDGQYLSADQKLLYAFTPGRGKWHGVFETMRAARGQAEYLDEHLSRLRQGLKVLKIRHDYTMDGLKRIVRQVIKQNPSIKLGRLRVMVFTEGKTVHCAVMILKYDPPSSQQYREGLRISVVKTNRPATARWADVKSLDYELFADAYERAKTAGYDDALLVNSKGHVFETTRANIFIRWGGKLLTPPLTSGCLNGIVRRRVIAAARRLNIPMLEKNLSVAMVKNAQEVYATNSMMGVIKIRPG